MLKSMINPDFSGKKMLSLIGILTILMASATLLYSAPPIRPVRAGNVETVTMPGKELSEEILNSTNLRVTPEDFESSNGGYEPEPSPCGWQWGIPTFGPSAYSGERLWATNLYGRYRSGLNMKLERDFIATGDSTKIMFYHWGDIEGYSQGYTWDGGNVALSTDNGATWTVIEPVGGYPNYSIIGLDGEPGYSGYFDWSIAVFDLWNYVSPGDTFRLRWRFGSDIVISYAGWYLDDISCIDCTPLRLEHDVGIGLTEVPGKLVTANIPVEPQAIAFNFGENTENFSVTCRIDSAGVAIYTDNQIVAGLVPQVAQVCNFAEWTPDGPYNIYDITFYTNLTGDQNTDNDAMGVTTTSVEVITLPYYQDFEPSNGGYAPNPPICAWEWGSPTGGPGSAHSGTNCWAVDGYPDMVDWRLETPLIDLTDTYAMLSFYHWYNMEGHFDGGNVKISTDYGNTWSIIYPENGYPENHINGTNSGIPDEPAYSGAQTYWDSTSTRFNLIPYIGDTVIIRWHFGSDWTTTWTGWYIDDIRITPVDVGFINGSVTDLSTGAPINGAIVTAHNTGAQNFSDTTDANGYYEIPPILAGIWSLTASVFGYNDSTVTEVQVIPDETTEVNFALRHPEILVQPTSLCDTLEFNTTYDDTMYIYNNGDGPLNFSISVEVEGTYATRDPGDIIEQHPAIGSPLGFEWDGTYFWQGNNDREVVKLDTDFNVIATYPSMGSQKPTGLAWHDGYLYQGCWGENNVYKIDVSNGYDPVSTIPVPGAGGLHGVEWIGDHLWITDHNTNSIYECDSLGNMINSWTTPDNIPAGISYNPYLELIYLNGCWDANVYTMDPQTGEFNFAFSTGSWYSCFGSSFDPRYPSYVWITDCYDGITLYDTGNEVTPWLSVAPGSGIVPANQTLEVIVHFNAYDAIHSLNYADIIIYNNSATNEITVPVTMYIPGIECTIQGTVTDAATGSPISDAQVNAYSSQNYITYTNADGNYILQDIIPDTYDMTVKSFGYNDFNTYGIVVQQGETIEVDFELLHPEIVVEPASFEVELPVDTTFTAIMTISNPGNGPLEYEINICNSKLIKSIDLTPVTTMVKEVSENIANTGFDNSHVELSVFPISERSVNIAQPESKSLSRDEVIIHYDGGAYSAVGFTGGGTIEGAIRLTPEELGPYNGWNLTSVLFYYYTGSCTGTVNIYGPGTSSSPGALIYSQPYSVSQQNWWRIDLASSLKIDASQDIWVSVIAPHSAGDYPLGVDEGPAVYGKGDFTRPEGGVWTELYLVGMSANWNIRAIVAPIEWLSVTPVSGTVPAGQSLDIDVNFDTNELTPDSTYTTSIFIHNNSTDSPVEIPVTLYVTTVGIDDPNSQVPGVFALGQNYPNPLNPQTTISYTIPKPCKVSLKIYNIKGQLVETLVNEDQQPGNHSVVWDSNDMSSGIYLYRINAGDFTETKKCIILK